MTPQIVSENTESTIATFKAPAVSKSSAYQSEAELERAFIKQLEDQAYEYLPIKTEADLILNLRKCLEQLNKIQFTDKEWSDFFKGKIASSTAGIVEKTAMLQADDTAITITRENGEPVNIRLLDKVNIHNNHLQVINQYVPEGGTHENRYDVTILVNGLPLVHIELKRRGIDIREAFNQIKRYNRDSFWAGSGLFEYVQIFVISNGTFTKYYSNTTRNRHIKEMVGSQKPRKGKVSSNSFEFTSWWCDEKKRRCTDLVDFTASFFEKRRLLSILARFCVFTVDKDLLAMRPYQIYATEAILNRIDIAVKNKERLGTIDAGGYIWHTTGSGKTLTSFKTAILASRLPEIAKVLFVVDRADLDYQTVKEYDRFQKGAANSNANTAILTGQLGDTTSRIIITTIQKLSIFLKKNPTHAIYGKPVVIIFDECHRSQFGEWHQAITKAFKKYALFGFTGTPIFAANAGAAGEFHLRTTAQAFGDKLHVYTIVDAINDKNVLPFRVDYIRTIKSGENIKDEKIRAIDRERALLAPERINKVTEYILEHFDQKTRRETCFSHKDRKLKGFNSIFATASTDAAKLYYSEFKKRIAELPSDKRLKIATIFSFGANEEDPNDGILAEENGDSIEGLDQTSRDFLDSAIADYNKQFNVNFSTNAKNGHGFADYYKDVSQRMKDRELDMLIVVNMFLTGFDATTLNTLWVDKNLRMHGLLQAYSRTNRILNSVKTYGNIVCFRNLEQATDESLALFGDEDAKGIVLMRTFAEYMNGYTDKDGKQVKGYKELVDELLTRFGDPAGILNLSDKEKRDFARLYGAILRAENILCAFDEFGGNTLLKNGQDYRSAYIEVMHQIRPAEEDKKNINDDLVFEVELLKQVAVNIDYILMLIHKYHEGHLQDKEIVVKIQKAVDSNVDLKNKKDLINGFVDSLTPTSKVDNDWKQYVTAKREAELADLIKSENLNEENTRTFINDCLNRGYVVEEGTQIGEVLPPMSMFNRSKNSESRSSKLRRVIEKFKVFVARFYMLIANG